MPLVILPIAVQQIRVTDVMSARRDMKPGKASPEQLKARLERRRSNAAGVHLNKGLRDAQDWRKDVDDELDERFEDG